MTPILLAAMLTVTNSCTSEAITVIPILKAPMVMTEDMKWIPDPRNIETNNFSSIDWDNSKDSYKVIVPYSPKIEISQDGTNWVIRINK